MAGTGSAFLTKAQFTGSISGTSLTVTAMSVGLLIVGDQIVGAGVAAGTVISSASQTGGGVGNYTVSISQTVASGSMSAGATINTLPPSGAALASVSLPMALATDQLSQLAQEGAPPTGVSMPAGGSGMEGWLGAAFQQGQQALQSAGLGYANCNLTQATALATTPSSPLIAARTGQAGAGRGFVTLTNQGTVTVNLGQSATNLPSAGFPLPPGASLTVPTTAAIYGQAASSTAVIGIVEAY